MKILYVDKLLYTYGYYLQQYNLHKSNKPLLSKEYEPLHDTVSVCMPIHLKQDCARKMEFHLMFLKSIF